MSFTTITMTGTFKDQAGNAASGSVVFRLSTPLIDSSTNEIRAAVPIRTNLSALGAISVPLTATNDPTTTPTGATYTVVEEITGAAVRSYSITVPYNSAGGTLDLADATPVTNTTLSTTISLVDGTVAAPSLSFIAETTSGLYRIGAGILGWAILGVERLRLSATELLVSAGLKVTGTIQRADGAASAGNLSDYYTSDTDLGRWRIGANEEGHFGSLAIRGPRPWVDLKAYCALDGVTDDTAGFVAAVAAAAGGTVYHSGGTCLISAVITVSTAGTVIRGVGETAIIRQKNTSNAHLVNFTAVGCQISDVALDGNATNNPTSGSGVQISAADCVVERCYIHDVKGEAVRVFTGGLRARIVNNRIEDCGTGVYADGSFGTPKQSHVLVDGNTIRNINVGQGVYVGTGCIGWRIANNYIDTVISQGVEVYLDSDDAIVEGNVIIGTATQNMGISIASHNCRVLGNYVSGTDQWGIEIAGNHNVCDGNTVDTALGISIGINVSATLVSSYNVVSNNVVRNGAGRGIALDGASAVGIGNAIRGNTITDSVDRAIHAAGVDSDTTIEDNQIVYTGAIAVPTNVISISTNPRAHVIGNTVAISSTVASAGGTGIQLAGTTQDHLVVGNAIRGGSKLSHGITLGAAVSKSLVSGNHIVDTQSNIILVSNNVATVIVANNYGRANAGAGYTLQANTRSFMNFSESAGVYAAGAGLIPFAAGWFTGDLELDGAINHDGTTVGFYGIAPATRPGAYTQTYATADKTHANPTAATLTVTDGAGTNDNTIGAITADASVIAAVQEIADEINKLVADLADVKQLVNAMIDDDQTLGLKQ